MHDTSPCKVLYVYTRTSAAKYQSPASLQARRQLQPNLPLPCFSRTQHAEAAAAAFPRTVSPSRACYRTDAITRTHSPAIAGGRSRSHRSLPSASPCPSFFYLFRCLRSDPSDQRWSLLLFRRIDTLAPSSAHSLGVRACTTTSSAVRVTLRPGERRAREPRHGCVGDMATPALTSCLHRTQPAARVQPALGEHSTPKAPSFVRCLPDWPSCRTARGPTHARTRTAQQRATLALLAAWSPARAHKPRLPLGTVIGTCTHTSAVSSKALRAPRS